jgi:prepilin-type N-terminal cleavage/methylation domain-containing protein
VKSRNGFSLVETMIVVVITGIIVLLGYPKVRDGLVRNNLRSARTTLVNMVAAARAAGAQTNRTTWLKLEGNKALVMARPRLVDLAGSNADTIGTVNNLQTLYGVTVASGADPDSIRFDRYLALVNPVTLTVSKGSHSETVSLDGMGRVLK